jgi:acyl dehydratase
MALSSALAGAASELRTAEADPRWTMAYAAALGDLLPCYMDTRRPAQLLAHPMFPVCFEWPLVVELTERLRATGLAAEEAARGVHATHDLLLYRPIRPPERLVTRATVSGLEQRAPGVYQLVRLDTWDSRGDAVCTTWYGTLYRGLKMSGSQQPAQPRPALPSLEDRPPAPRSRSVVHIGAAMSHVYTECARIYNPIHTDIRAAQEAGLGGLILHGTATLALAVSRIVACEAEGDPRRVARVASRFRAMVTMPSDVTVQVLAREPVDDGQVIFFEALNAGGERAISDGVVGLRAH